MSKAILGLFARIGLVEEVPGQAEETAAPSTTVTPVAVVPAGTSLVQPAPKPAVSQDAARISAADTAAREQLELAVEQANADLAEDLLTTLGTLAAVIPDEKMRYQTALKLVLAKGQNRNISHVVGDLDTCLGALEAKSREFESQLKGQFDKRVGSKVTAVQNLEGQITAKQQQVAVLQQEIQELITRKGQEQSGISEEQAKLDLAQQRFTLQYQNMRRQVEEQKAKIAQYGEGV